MDCKTIKVVIVDDHAILRSGLRMLINSQPDMAVIGEAPDVADLWRILTARAADVVLLDIGLPRTSGFQALKQLREKFRSTKVIILSMHNEVALVRSAVSEGAAGFVCKEAADAELLAAIRTVYKGGIFLNPYMTSDLLRDRTGIRAAAPNLLSERERQVIRMIARGYSNQEIARGIHISVKTVETYRARVFEKLGLRTRTEIARYAFATGLLSREDFLNDKWTA